jgi:hypothetical protein
MKYLTIISLVMSLLGCKNEENVVVTFPMYKECKDVLNEVEAHLNRPGATYSVEVTVKDYGVAPEYGDFSSGLGTLRFIGSINLLDGSTAEDYLKSHISSMYHACMPNNSVLIGDSGLAKELRYQLRSNYVSGYIEKDKFWALVNDGSYTYLEKR